MFRVLDKFATPLYLQNSKELLRKHNTINNFQHLIYSIIISLHAITRSINEYRSVCMTVCLSISIKLHIISFGIHHGKSDTARKLDKCSITYIISVTNHTVSLGIEIKVCCSNRWQCLC